MRALRRVTHPRVMVLCSAHAVTASAPRDVARYTMLDARQGAGIRFVAARARRRRCVDKARRGDMLTRSVVNVRSHRWEAAGHR